MRRSLVTLLLCALFVSGCENDPTPGPVSAPSTTESPVADTLPCRTYRPSTTSGTVKDAELNELSGLARGVRNPKVLWTHNDSGDEARVFAISPTGERIATVDIENADVFDVEDIALFGNDIWIADTGDNLHFRSTVHLFRFPEPDTNTGNASLEAQRIDVKFQRPNGNGTYSVDSEALFFDPKGNGYLVEKTKDAALAWVYKLPAQDLRTSKSVIAQPVVQITGNSNGSGVGPTAADMSADGTTLAIKNYSETFVWRFTTDSSVSAVLTKQTTAPCVVKAGLGEAIAFDGNDLVTIEEGVGKPLRRTRAKN